MTIAALFIASACQASIPSQIGLDDETDRSFWVKFANLAGSTKVGRQAADKKSPVVWANADTPAFELKPKSKLLIMFKDRESASKPRLSCDLVFMARNGGPVLMTATYSVEYSTQALTKFYRLINLSIPNPGPNGQAPRVMMFPEGGNPMYGHPTRYNVILEEGRLWATTDEDAQQLTSTRIVLYNPQ
ncbi:MAG: hypothetical protein ABSH53_01100 [Holophaga sp.]